VKNITVTNTNINTNIDMDKENKIDYIPFSCYWKVVYRLSGQEELRRARMITICFLKKEKKSGVGLAGIFLSWQGNDM